MNSLSFLTDMVTQPEVEIDLSRIDWNTLSYARIHTRDCKVRERHTDFLNAMITGRRYFLKKQRTDSDGNTINPDLEMTRISQIGDHPNIIKCYGAVDIYKTKIQRTQINGRYTILEYLKDSKDIREKEMTSLEKLVCLFLISQSLRHMHSQDILNLDIKPGNILVNGKFVKMIDFEGAMRVSELETNKTRFSAPLYLSPEALLVRDYGKYSDIYSLGAVICDILMNDNQRSVDDIATKRESTKRIVPIMGRTKEETALHKYISGELDLINYGVLDSSFTEEMVDKLAFDFSNPQALEELVELVGSMLERDKDQRPEIDELVDSMESIIARDEILSKILEERQKHAA